MTDSPCCENYPHPNMAPGQPPYTCAEITLIYGYIAEAADDDPGEESEEI